MLPKKTGRIQYYCIYSVLFVLLCLAVFRWYFFAGKTFIWKVDGWDQHYKALVYYGKYLRGIIRTLLNKHRLILPEWDFSLSEGSDILSVFHYYVMGDPLCLISAVVPSKHTHILFTGLILLRLYLSGISFSELCFYFNRSKKLPVMTGAFSYVFSYYAIVFAARHPYFLNPMMYFPLVILGVEKVLSGKRPVLLCVSVALSASSNFYFFYMIVILTVIYSIVRAVSVFKTDFKGLFKAAFKVFLVSFTGVLISGISTLPVFYFFLSDSRLSVSRPWHLFYPSAYYRSLPSVFISDYQQYWLCLSLTAPVIIGLFVLWMKKERKVQKTLFILGLIMILLPFFGKALNGFSYISYRWSWAFLLLFSFILTDVFEDMTSLKKKEKAVLLLVLIAFTCLCFITREEDDIQMSSGLFLLWLTYILLWIPEMRPAKKDKDGLLTEKTGFLKTALACLVVLVTFLGIYRISYYRNSPEGADYASKLVDDKNVYNRLLRNETRELLQQTDALAKKTEDDTVVRYSGNKLTYNAGMLRNFSSTDYNWSLTNPFIDRFRTDLNLRENVISKYYGYDDRTDLLTLASVNYFIIPGTLEKTSGVPYGFTEVTRSGNETVGNTSLIFKNDYALPSGYLYDSYISAQEWEALNPLEKQNIMLSAAVTDINTAHLPEEFREKAYSGYETEDAIHTIPIEITPLQEQGIQVSPDLLSVTTEEDNCKIQLTFSTNGSEEVYVLLKGLDYKSRNKNTDITDLEIGFKASSGTEKTLSYYTEDYDFYGGRHDFLINMGYHEEPLSSVDITLPYPGTYSCDSINVLTESFDEYEEKVKALKKNTLKEITYGTDKVSGVIQNNREGILCITIPFTEGFKAKVDGEETQLFCVNGRYTGLYLPAGNHRINLVYSRPYQKAGYFVTAFGLAAGLLYLIKNKRNKNKNNQSNTQE